MDTFVLRPKAVLPDQHLILFRPFPSTIKKPLPTSERIDCIRSHCTTRMIEEINKAAQRIAIKIWLSIFHLIPRLLLLTSLHHRHQSSSDINRPPSGSANSFTYRSPMGGRQVGAPRDLRTFRRRCL